MLAFPHLYRVGRQHTSKLWLNRQHVVCHSDGLHKMTVWPIMLELKPDELAALQRGASPCIFAGQRWRRDNLLVKDGIADEGFQQGFPSFQFLFTAPEKQCKG